MMVDRLFVVWLKGYLEHAQALVLEEHFVMFWRGDYGIQRRIPSRRVQVRTIVAHGDFAPL